jgi:hypothetical protein
MQWLLGALALAVAACSHQTASTNNADAGLDTSTDASSDPVHVPLTMTQTNVGTYKANIQIGIGDLAPLSFILDTGSTGLHVFAAAKLDAAGSGVDCTGGMPISFTVSNPGRFIYSGVVCNAPLHLGDFVVPQVPIAYLTSADCAPDNPGCTPPDVNDPAVHGGYGILGAGISGPTHVTNPLITLPAPRDVYSIDLTTGGGELVLGAHAGPSAVDFPMATASDATWDKPTACLFVDEHALGSCLAISFDTGNGAPWIRAPDTSGIPQSGGYVTPTTRIGFAPTGAATEAFALTAGQSSSFPDRITVTTETAGLTNVGIGAFLGRSVTYDHVRGTISVEQR